MAKKATKAKAAKGKSTGSVSGTRNGRSVKFKMEGQEFMDRLGAGIVKGLKVVMAQLQADLTATKAQLGDVATRLEQLAEKLQLKDDGR